jgi:hypothetical protein
LDHPKTDAIAAAAAALPPILAGHESPLVLAKVRKFYGSVVIQRVLTEPARMTRMTADDFRALTPLVYLHVTPYGTFDMDMEQRLAI